MGQQRWTSTSTDAISHGGRLRRTGLWLGALASVLVLVAASGCYRRVVRESGPGARQPIYEPNVDQPAPPAPDSEER